MHADMTADTIQSNKIGLNGVKRQLSTTIAIVLKTKECFGQPNNSIPLLLMFSKPG